MPTTGGSCSRLCRSSVNIRPLTAALPVSCSSWLHHVVSDRKPDATRRPCSTRSNAERQTRPGKPTNIADLEGSPFFELGLKDIQDGMGRTRVRQHVNPLASQFQQPTPSPDWAQLYKDPQLPLYVDMGCGPGRFLLLLCRRHQQLQQPMNYLGLEIRQPLVERANKWAQELQLDSHVHYLFTNVSVSLAGLLQDYPGPIDTLSAQFPDPLFKKRHKKRRMVQQSVVQAARELLRPGGHIFLQSDIYDAVAAMRDEFEQHAGDVLQLSTLHSTAAVFNWSREQEAAAQGEAAAAAEQISNAASPQQQRLASIQQQQRKQAESSLKQKQEAEDTTATLAAGADAPISAEMSAVTDWSRVGEVAGDDVQLTSQAAVVSEANSAQDDFVPQWAAGGWLVDNPLGVPTEREHYVLTQGGKVFRVLLVKQ